MSLLKETYLELVLNYSKDTLLNNQLWDEIELNYSHKKRYYHNLSHLDNLLTQLQEIKYKIYDCNSILFSLYYHDIIYNPIKSNNEAKSADLAVNRMNELNVEAKIVEKCKSQILATKLHIESVDVDTNYFTDADLCILGQDWDMYFQYSKDIRKEYALYPNFIYNAGRKKALNHFLNMPRIYKTEVFFEKFENQAKRNIEREIELL